MGYDYRHVASAVAAGGVFRRPNHLATISAANLALPPSGGAAHIEQTDYALGDLIRIGYAYCAVSGTQGADGSWDTLATTVLEKVSIQGVITADRIVARLAVNASLNKDGKGGAYRASLAGTHFNRLRVGGVELAGEPCLDQLEGLYDWPAFQGKCKAKPFNARAVGEAFRVSAWRAGQPKSALWQRGEDDQEIYLPNFGRVRFGEYYVSARERSISMIQLRIGSPDEGEGDIGAVGGSGHPPP